MRCFFDTLIINLDTYSEALQRGSDLWVEVRSKYTVVLMSPEELSSRGFFQVLEHPKFYERIYAMGVDEAHLLYWWGKRFRPPFRQVGLVRARLPSRMGFRTPVVAVTATLRTGEPAKCVREVLGLVPGQYHFIRRSNMRHDIQIVFRELHSGLNVEGEIFSLSSFRSFRFLVGVVV